MASMAASGSVSDSESLYYEAEEYDTFDTFEREEVIDSDTRLQKLAHIMGASPNILAQELLQSLDDGQTYLL